MYKKILWISVILSLFLLVGTIGFYFLLELVFPCLPRTELINGYGILGTFISGLAFIGFLAALFLQRDDTKTQQKNTQVQGFESMFFNLIEGLNDGLEHVRYQSPLKPEPYHGREAFIRLYEYQNEMWRGLYNRLRGLDEKNNSYIDTDAYKQAAQEVYAKFKHDIERSFFNYSRPHFTIVLTCLQLIEDNKELLDKAFSKYVDILSSYLTVYEKWALLLYLEIKPHPLTSRLVEIGIFEELTKSDFTDPTVLYEFRSKHSSKSS